MQERALPFQVRGRFRPLELQPLAGADVERDAVQPT